jgi:Protein of unknown function (DUF2778)
MGSGTGRRCNTGWYDHRRSARKTPQRLAGAAALVCVVAACGWTVCANVFGAGNDQIEGAGARGDKLFAAISRGDKLLTATSRGDEDDLGTRGDKLAVVRLNAAARPPASANNHAGFFDPGYWGLPDDAVNRTASFGGGSARTASAASPSRPAILHPQDIPPPPARRDEMARSERTPALQLRRQQIRTASLRDEAPDNRAVADSAPEKPTIFEKIFGKPSPVTLAYAAADDGGLAGDGARVTGGRYDRSTAVYDISAHAVYLPDGTKLEAHSGRGDMLDDPRYAAEKDRGVTPPDVYDLEPRDGLFHGVRALRLIPEDERKVFGRTGLLAHSFMLGPNGDSLGCVSIRDYDAFLKAYTSGEIKRLVVVTRL